jgi:dTDP-4-amino-4,6-dideoxygalactose transaminase
MDRVVIPFLHNKEFVSNYIFPVVLKESTVEIREKVRAQLHEAGTQTSVHYPAAHRFSIYRPYESKLEKTEYVTDNEITLPMYAKLDDEEIDYIAETLAGILKQLLET